MIKTAYTRFIFLTEKISSNIISRKEIIEIREIFNEEIDAYIFEEINKIRKNVENMPDWQLYTNRVLEEKQIDSLPQNVLQKIIKKSLLFLSLLPAGHSIGHAYRDIINLAALLQDNDLINMPKVEMVIGIFAGTFHDIGNSLVDRYKEHDHFCGHGEIGAYLFGLLAKNEIKKELLELIQFAIAGHTNYLKPITIIHGNSEKVRQSYNTVVGKNQEKIGAWLTRMTDRLDINGLPIVMRHIIANAMPVTNFIEENFHLRKNTELEEFYKQTYRDEKNKETILGHFAILAYTATMDTPFSHYDPIGIRKNIFIPQSKLIRQFIDTVILGKKEYTEKERTAIFEKFYKLCQLFEPADDTVWKICKLREKFPALSVASQNAWAEGFELLLSSLFPQWYRLMQQRLSKCPRITYTDTWVQGLLDIMYSNAQIFLKAFDPVYLEKETKNFPNLLNLI